MQRERMMNFLYNSSVSHTHAAIKSFKYASDGVRQAFKQEPNFRAHIVIAILALAVALFLGLSPLEWAILLLTIVFVIALELLNTAVEELIDIVSPHIDPRAKVAKDVAAAAVLLSAIVACIIGAILFLPKILALLSYLM